MNEDIILYSTGCPKCSVLKAKLDAASITYMEINDVDTMLSKGLSTAPALEANGRLMDFAEAIVWVNQRGGDSTCRSN